MSISIKIFYVLRNRISQIITIGIVAGCLISTPWTLRGQQASTAPLWGALQPGPFAVGFRAIYRMDLARTWRVTRPYDKPFAPDPKGRPIRISVWYPAQLNGNSRPMHYEDYIRTGKEKEFADLDKILEQRDRLIAGLSVPPARLADLMATRMNAFQDAPPAAGRYPLVLYFGGLNDTSTINLFVLAEFLASHGYVVATIPLLGPTNEQPPQTRTPADLERTISDLEFAWSILRKETDVDESKLAVTGQSLGGIEAVLFAMRNANVSAAVGLDATYGFAGATKVLTDFYGYAPQKMRAALLDLRKAAGIQETVIDMSAVSALHYSDRTFITVQMMHHSDFTSFAMVAQEFHLGNSPGYIDKFGWNRETGEQGYQVTCAIVLDFLDGKLKGDLSSAQRLKADVARAAGGVLKHEAGLPAPPSTDEFAKLIATRGLEAAKAIVERYRRDLPDENIVDQSALNSTGYSLIAEHKLAEAIGVLRLVAYAYPNSANAQDSLADAYIAAGQKDLARQSLQKALELLPADSSLDAETKKSMTKDEQMKLEQLKP